MSNYNRLKCFLIEDEPLASYQIQKYIQSTPILELISTVEYTEDFNINAHHILQADILFLDINIKGGEIHFLEPYLSKISYIIITSVLPSAQYPAFIRTNPYWILRKPITQYKFHNCIKEIVAKRQFYIK